MTADGERGWVCSEKGEHFQRASERPAFELVPRSPTQATWDDDGGAAQPRSRDALAVGSPQN